ncbi:MULTISPECIES: pyridoxamine 5'-phosphate oxidase family protein [unclassified Amycolatopsis]|uniref:pyridoxamine 5'-phosphate oxidase family protein n=1 Tax=unclassified Amycolatopsis TaxID=2618356 RepID=UPI002873F734|nr:MULTISPECIES: pyridoxamine 5'-phosphate oxidase family protein [unclassified Amycolatopsis]MDS0132632.1 pyridoxamine 5'-phosphate oxidase family protein [Amycolatopsis sp. 505]MDS0142543.1 pyridoxamine 5'-phosphate oxidase family protein [Amycolatopsis sp. CM201R]
MGIIDSHEALREVIGEAAELTQQKVIDRIDEHARTLIAHSPFVLLATSAPDGSCDVSPRGDPAGSVLVLDDRTLVLADRPGNKLIDSFRNIVDNPHAGLLFLIPGMNETLRVNGRAKLVSDAPFFDDLVVRGKRPKLAVVVEVEELYMHCAKAFLRSSLWQPETWPDRSTLPSMGTIMRDQMSLPIAAGELDARLDERARTQQY